MQLIVSFKRYPYNFDGISKSELTYSMFLKTVYLLGQFLYETDGRKNTDMAIK